MFIRFSRVSGFLAVCSRQVMAYLLVLFSESKKAFAFLFFSRSLRKSAGVVELEGESYAAASRPSCFASSKAFSPAAFILFSLVSRSICSMFRFDHILRARRGVNFWIQESGSTFFFCPSIQP